MGARLRTRRTRGSPRRRRGERFSGYFVTLNPAEVGRIPYDGLATHFSAKQPMLHKAAPSIGEDTELVMREVLGLSVDEITAFAVEGVFV